ncbi:hypothetical protein HDV03_004810 [Kappamyces sp. JEL0829]|nr:hypothetical protein HDV03_004810 [Kappamyces sp. JEL0829]
MTEPTLRQNTVHYWWADLNETKATWSSLEKSFLETQRTWRNVTVTRLTKWGGLVAKELLGYSLLLLIFLLGLYKSIAVTTVDMVEMLLSLFEKSADLDRIILDLQAELDHLSNTTTCDESRNLEQLPAAGLAHPSPIPPVSAADPILATSKVSLAESAPEAVEKSSLGMVSPPSLFRSQLASPPGFAAKAADYSSPPLSHLQSLPNPDVKNTLYFGKLPPSLSISELLNHISGGTVEEARMAFNYHCCYITFVDATVAMSLHQDFVSHPLTIMGWEIKVGWANPPPPNPLLMLHIESGATRNLVLRGLADSETNESLRKAFSGYGPVECVRIVPEDRMAHIHFCSIAAAVAAKAGMKGDVHWNQYDCSYGTDRCLSLPSAPFLGDGNRTVFIGGIPFDVTYKDICDVVRGGPLQYLKYFPKNHTCFVTFIDHAAASAFYNRFVTRSLSHSSLRRARIGWGKPSSGPLPDHLAEAVAKGATRSVYLGNIHPLTPSHEALHKEFSKYGYIEQIKIVSDKNTAFISFTDIQFAIQAVDDLRDRDPKGRVVNFAKDRCAIPLRSW